MWGSFIYRVIRWLHQKDLRRGGVLSLLWQRVVLRLVCQEDFRIYNSKQPRSKLVSSPTRIGLYSTIANTNLCIFNNMPGEVTIILFENENELIK